MGLKERGANRRKELRECEVNKAYLVYLNLGTNGEVEDRKDFLGVRAKKEKEVYREEIR